jgi:hypothetical protein
MIRVSWNLLAAFEKVGSHAGGDSGFRGTGKTPENGLSTKTWDKKMALSNE